MVPTSCAPVSTLSAPRHFEGQPPCVITPTLPVLPWIHCRALCHLPAQGSNPVKGGEQEEVCSSPEDASLFLSVTELIH